MKKLSILMIVLLLGAAGWGGATYVLGGKVESQYLGLVEQYGQWGPLTLSNQTYERGLLSSRAATLLAIILPPAPQEQDRKAEPQTVQMLFEHKIHHGPILFGETPSAGLALFETRLARISPGEEELEKLFQQVPALRETLATVRVNFDGSTDGRLQIQPFTAQADKVEIDCGGLTSSLAISPGAGTLSAETELPNIVIRTADATMIWKGIRGHANLTEALPMLYVGTSQAEFGGLDLTLPDTDGGPRVVRIKKAEIVSASDLDGKMVHFNQVVNFDGLSVGGENYGPLKLDLGLRNLDGQTLSDMQVQLQDVYRQAKGFSPDQIAAKMVPIYSQFLSRMIAGKPEVNVRRFYLATPQGEADGTFRVELTDLPAAPLDSPAAMLGVLQYLNAALEVALDETLVNALLVQQVESGVRASLKASPQAKLDDREIATIVERQAGMQLEMWAAQKFIVRDGNKIKTSATFREGELTVNGKVLPLTGG